MQSMKRTFIIYKITNLINGKIYIGQTTRTLEERISNHIYQKRKSLIHQAIVKYGWENFKAEIVEVCKNIEELNDREKYWIAHYDCISPNGYNLTDGGSNGIRSKATLKKMSRISKERLKDPELRARITKALTGRKDSEEVKANKSVAQKKRYEENPEACKIQSEGLHRRFSKPEEREKQSNARKKYLDEHPEEVERLRNLGGAAKEYFSDPENRKKHSEIAKERYQDPAEHEKTAKALKKYYDEHPEEVEKITKAAKERAKTPEGKAQIDAAREKAVAVMRKRVRCVETGEIFESVSAAAKQYHISHQNISAVCRRPQRTAAGKHWEYVDQ